MARPLRIRTRIIYSLVSGQWCSHSAEIMLPSFLSPVHRKAVRTEEVTGVLLDPVGGSENELAITIIHFLLYLG